jgi:hypothetical protein
MATVALVAVGELVREARLAGDVRPRAAGTTSQAADDVVDHDTVSWLQPAPRVRLEDLTARFVASDDVVVRFWADMTVIDGA